jgi:large subunit ribosomal protein L15
MKLSDVHKIRVKRKQRHRVGRGQGSGWGTTSGRGNKGAGQRSGTTFRLHFEGGQMPLYRRLPKKGFTNATFKTSYHVVNVGDLAASFADGAAVDLDGLKAVGLAPKKARYLKILGWGDLDRSLAVTAHAISKGARTKIEEARGSVTLLAVRAAPRPKGVKKPARADEASS